MTELTEIATRIQAAAGLPELLSVSFEAFEAIRLLARRYEDQAEELLATFMTAADAAVCGREAITAAPALATASRNAATLDASTAETTMAKVIDDLAALGALLAGQLAGGMVLAGTAGDRAACREAVLAAQEIRALMARGDDDRRPG
jgi:hypothetical protein